MTTIDPQRTVAELVTELPGRARVFERLGVDYCCGGGRSLESACAGKELDLDVVLADLDRAGDDPDEPGADWAAASLADLCEHLVETHHAFLRSELPRLDALVEKVARAHADVHPELREVQEVYSAVAEELEGHMSVEENVVFPSCRTLEAGHGELVGLARIIKTMELEHRDTGSALERLWELTDGYTPPEDACNSYRAMLDGLVTLERDLHRHMHEENNILFPRAMALEEGWATAARA